MILLTRPKREPGSLPLPNPLSTAKTMPLRTIAIYFCKHQKKIKKTLVRLSEVDARY
jgi:hypothetical protein